MSRWRDFSIPGRAEALPGAVFAGAWTNPVGNHRVISLQVFSLKTVTCVVSPLFVHTANIIPQSAAVIVLMVSISPVLLYADIAFIVQIAALNPLTTNTNISISEPLSFNPTFNQSSQSVSS